MSFSKAIASITPPAGAGVAHIETLRAENVDVSKRRLLRAAGAGLGLAGFVPAWAGATSTSSVSSPEAAGMQIEVPKVSLIRHDGSTVRLDSELDDGRAIYLNFIFTSCAAICPASSQLFAQLQRRLGERASGVHLVSVSIDPENDTPARLREYATEHGARRGWDHYTGSMEDSERVQRAFGAWRGDKMNHLPAVWFRAAPRAMWRRVDGFVTPRELQKLLPSHSNG